MSDGIQRRDFLKVVGVGGAGAGLAGCSTESVEKLMPYVVPPEDITPGVATWYATTCGECPAGCGVWARTREGRVVMLEGNPNHPVSGGGTCSRGVSALQALYHPDRITGPMRKNGDTFEPISWDDAEALLAQQLGSARGNAVLLHGHVGPAMADLAAAFVSSVGGTAAELEALSVAPLREASRIAFGRDAVPTYDIASARLVVSFGADFLGGWLSPVEHGRAFAEMSHADERGSKGKLVFVGPRLSLTGQNADEWIPIRPGSEAVVALAMASVIASSGGNAGPYAALLQSYDVAGAASQAGVSEEAIQSLAAAFMNEGPSLAIGPGSEGQHDGATAAHLAVLVLNSVAGNVGRTLHVNGNTSAASGSVGDAIAAVRGASGGVVMVHGTNPLYSLPDGTGFTDAFSAAGFRVSFAQTMDETAAACDLILPDRHTLESWGDANPRDDTWSLQQPVMQPVPMFDSKQTGDVLLAVAGRMGADVGGGATTFYEYLQGRWRAAHATMSGVPAFDAWWREVLKSGFAASSVARAAEATPLQAPDTALSFEPVSFQGDGDYLLSVYPSARFGDGKFANRPWLQELPDPVSKIMWQSWVEMHPHAVEEMGLRSGDVVRVSSSAGEIEAPVFPYPGIRTDVVAVATGGGHTNYGRYADGNGVNAMDLLGGDTEAPSGGLVYAGGRVTVTPTGTWQKPATIEGSSSTHDRPIAPAIALSGLGHAEEEEEGGHGPLKELQLMGGFGPVATDGQPEDFPLPGMSEYAPYDGGDATPRWAMAIDLDKCTGCSACVTACQAENNVPWVGEDQIIMGRDMHWMRIERYYEHVDAEHAGPVDVRHLPMLCQHCGNAPCEPVCPVYAAYHTPSGLNAQVYNRCVGTRYCANNCPYKVRVFNWYGYAYDIPEPLNWQFNPDVTVRDNGVMEKCSFCVQRIRDAENLAAISGRDLRDGDVVPACEQSCPAEAIVFGNIRDPNSRVAQVSHNERSYKVLDALVNTQPAVSYLKKVTFHDVQEAEH